MKVLLLLIHSSSPIYNEMFSIQQQYVNKFKEVKLIKEEVINNNATERK